MIDEEKIAQVTKQMFEDSKAERPQTATSQPVDVYQNKRNNRYENSWKAQSFGSPSTLNSVARDMADSISSNYNLAVNQFNHLQEYNMQEDAQTMADNYMEQDFIPVVMGLVDQYGADSILKNQRVLDILDEKALTGNGDGTGYTASFIKTMAPEVQGTVASVSDAELENQMKELNQLANESPRDAISMAMTLKERVDNGEISASFEDYSTLANIVANR